MKKTLSMVLAAVMLFCSVFCVSITGYASTKVDEAITVNLNEQVDIKTTYDASEDYECAHCWISFTTTTAGSYAIKMVLPDEDTFCSPMVYPSKTAAITNNLDYVLDASGILYNESEESFSIDGYTFDLKADTTYYIDLVALNFENDTAEPNIKLTIEKHIHTYEPYTVPADTEYDGETGKMCTTCYADKDVVTIPYIKSVKLEATSLTYNGKVRTPRVIVKDAKGKTLVKGTDYTVTYAKGRKYVGKYNVVIKFKGKYEGTVKKSFTIKPAPTSIVSVSPLSKSFKVKWKKKTTQTTGYQIQYSTSSKFKNPKYVTVGKNSTVSKTVSKLLGKKKYYVRVRTYKTVKVDGKTTKIFSSWSKAKSITTKR